jgi:ferredoxin-like protein FixX
MTRRKRNETYVAATKQGVMYVCPATVYKTQIGRREKMWRSTCANNRVFANKGRE